MKFEHFKAGKWFQRHHYKSFEPELVNHEWIWEDATINTLLESANRALGELNVFSLIVPDIDLFINMHVYKEAQTSSRIEGTQTGMDEALMPEEQIQVEKRNDWQEIRNYVDAMNSAIRELAVLPLSNRLLQKTHAILLQGVRGEHKQPGMFRTSQNWIGGSSLTDAAFIPPHPDGIPEQMSDLERFWHNDALQVPHLIKLAISHYQFETIHPFLDGNGRIGRLLIPLYMVSQGLLAKPSLYLSDFFERNRAAYYDSLMRVRISNDIIHWVRFFLNGMTETATKGRDTFKNILILRTEVEASILALGKRTPNAKRVLNLLYRNPFITSVEMEKKLELSQPTAGALIRDFTRLGILTETTGQQRGRVYSFDRYLTLFLR